MVDRLARLVSIGLNLFLGLTAILGATAVPTLPLAWLAGTPFPDYTIPALALAAVGVSALVAAVLLLLGQPVGRLASLLVGLAISIYEVVETTVIGLDLWLHALGLRPTLDPVSTALLAVEDIPAPLGIPAPLWLQPLYLALGLALMVLAWRPWARRATGGQQAQPVGR